MIVPAEHDFDTAGEVEVEMDSEDNEELTETDILRSDNIGDVSVEINVEQLVSDIESVQTGGVDAAGARRRLDKLRDEKELVKAMRELDDFDFEE